METKDNSATKVPAPEGYVDRPVRVVLSRRKGWRMPENTVKVCRPSRYGNPFHVADVLEHYDGDKIAAQADCVRSYRRWIAEGVKYFCDDGPPSIAEIRRDLGGKNLACWCKAGTPCHADVLLDLANVPGQVSLLASGIRACSAGEMPEVPKAQGLAGPVCSAVFIFSRLIDMLSPEEKRFAAML